VSSDYTAIILAGGDAKRLGGVDKPALLVAGVPMVVRVLEAVADAADRIVVGPEGLPVPPFGVRVMRERPPGGGPVAAVAAALEEQLPTDYVAILGADLPLLTADAVTRLRRAAADRDGAVFVDRNGREQWLCGVWSVVNIQARLAGMEPVGAALRRLLAGLDFARVTDDAEMPPWFDCDTADDVKRAEEWLTYERA
jgi:molybdopterin-guanine dinucleotide biosynthesis protein A